MKVTKLSATEIVATEVVEDEDLQEDEDLCADCGVVVSEDEAIIIYDENYCPRCAIVCDACSDGVRGTDAVECSVCNRDFCSECCEEDAEGTPICCNCYR